MRSAMDRFTGRFKDERNVITGHRGARDDDGNWQPGVAFTLTEEAS